MKTAILCVMSLCVIVNITAQGVGESNVPADKPQNRPENLQGSETSTPKKETTTTAYYNVKQEQQKMLRKYIQTMVQEKYRGEPLLINGEAYPRYCFDEREKEHLYVVVPGSKCKRFFQHHPGAGRPSAKGFLSCPSHLSFDVSKCVCASQKDTSKCEEVSVNGKPGPGVSADVLVEEVLDKLKYFM